MRLWIDIRRDIEYILDDYDRIYDAWEEGGVDGIVIGPLVFNAADLLHDVKYYERGGEPVVTFDPDPDIYRKFGVEPPLPPQTKLEDRRAKLDRALSAAKDRGWSVWIFQPGSGSGPGGDGYYLADDTSRAAVCARIVDTLQRYPMADGGIMDGPEWGYEIDAEQPESEKSFDEYDYCPSVGTTGGLWSGGVPFRLPRSWRAQWSGSRVIMMCSFETRRSRI